MPAGLSVRQCANIWPAPAKLNLFLRVTGRRADGYHVLQTVFQILDHGDDIELAVRRDGRIVRRDGMPGVAPEADLTVRAARALAAAAGVDAGAEIRIRKRIPIGAGLGGGSSDAATVLVGLNRLWGLDWPRARLATLGLTLGADVPVFVHGRSAWAEGVGERLRPVALGDSWYVIVTPPCKVRTERVFSDPTLTRNSSLLTIPDSLRREGVAGAPELDPRALIEHGHNDCETVTRALYAEVGAVLDWLSGFGAARMSGTGGSVFLRCGDRRSAEAVYARVPGGWRAFVARGVDRSPLEAAALSVR